MVDLNVLSQGVNSVWMLVTAFLIFFMQPGIAMLEAGQVRTKNTANVLMKNLMDWGLGVLVYFLVGFGIASYAGGVTSPGGYTLTEAFAYVNDSGAWIEWLFAAVFVMTAATIVSGAVAGRIKFRAYVIYLPKDFKPIVVVQDETTVEAIGEQADRMIAPADGGRDELTGYEGMAQEIIDHARDEMGDELATGTARDVASLRIDDAVRVEAITGNKQLVVEQLADRYIGYAGPQIKNAFADIADEYAVETPAV